MAPTSKKEPFSKSQSVAVRAEETAPKEALAKQARLSLFRNLGMPVRAGDALVSERQTGAQREAATARRERAEMALVAACIWSVGEQFATVLTGHGVSTMLLRTAQNCAERSNDIC